MFNRIPILIRFSLIPLTLLCGCIEHTFNLTVFPEAEIEIVYNASGDVMDFKDDGQLMPDSTIWDLRTWTEKRNDETVHNVEARLRLADPLELDKQLNWQHTDEDTVHLQRSFAVEKHPNLLGAVWRFTGVMFSRDFNKIYGDIWDYVPAECKVLEDTKQMEKLTSGEIEMLEEKFSLGVIQWNIERFKKLFDRVWAAATIHIPALGDTSETVLSIARVGWMEDLHQYLNELEIGEPSVANLDWWSDLRPIFLGRLIDVTGPQTADLFGRIGDAIEHKYQISKDIEDDQYNFIVKMPGKTISSNGSPSEEGHIKWEFPGKELQNEDIIMTAKNFKLSTWRAVVLTFLIVLILNYIRRLLFRKRVRGVQNDSGN